jgi:predicted DsbA family dithiol-disulfide isomerase
VWSDYICPWAYLGRDRTALLRELGVTVDPLPYELHPELPPEGRALRPGGRMSRVYADIGRLCADVGMPFAIPTHVPNSRRALETAEAVRCVDGAAFERLDDALFRAHFVTGDDIGDPSVLDRLVTDAGADAREIRTLVEGGASREAVDASISTAHEHGIAATPAWLFVEQQFVLPGAQPRELFERVVSRLRARTG